MQKYVAGSQCVCLANYELSVNSGLIPIVIVIDCRFVPLFFSQKRHPDFGFLLYNYNKLP